MRLIVHDFSGHPFQAELARSLAQRGHQVLHAQCASYSSGKGTFGGDPGNPRYVAISLGREFERYRTGRRLLDEIRYARRFVAVARPFQPDLVISCNDPLVAKAIFGLWAARRRLPWIFWLQDIYSIAMTREAAKRSRLGRLVGEGLQWVERRLLRAADGVVAITDDFGPTLDAWGIDARKRTVIENWAPLDEVPPRPRGNPWRRDAGLGDRFVFLYAGTLGLKHDPGLLRRVAEADATAEVVVVSTGLGADQLRAGLVAEPLPNLHVFPFQPWEILPDVLGAADVLVVLLDDEAGVFSVPSKILTCLCAGRPILASIPSSNLGARTIEAAGAGLTIPPGEAEGFIAAAKQLRDDEGARLRMGDAARTYALAAFDIVAITDRFERVIEQAAGVRPEGMG